ncbi:MAG: PRC-barrel domain-containing protein [Hyphomicrobiaceae bacterium]
MTNACSRRAALVFAGIVLAMPSALAQTALDTYGPRDAASLIGVPVIDQAGNKIGTVNAIVHDGQGLPIVVKVGMGGIFGFFQRIVPVTVDLVELKTDAQGGRYLVVKKTKAQILGKAA